MQHWERLAPPRLLSRLLSGLLSGLLSRLLSGLLNSLRRLSPTHRNRESSHESTQRPDLPSSGLCSPGDSESVHKRKRTIAPDAARHLDAERDCMRSPQPAHDVLPHTDAAAAANGRVTAAVDALAPARAPGADTQGAVRYITAQIAELLAAIDTRTTAHRQVVQRARQLVDAPAPQPEVWQTEDGSSRPRRPRMSNLTEEQRRQRRYGFPLRNGSGTRESCSVLACGALSSSARGSTCQRCDKLNSQSGNHARVRCSTCYGASSALSASHAPRTTGRLMSLHCMQT